MLLTTIIAAVGCSDPGKPVRRYTLANAPDPLDEVRALLERYADGQPVSSEAMNFETLVGRVRETDPERAVVLEQGLAAIARSPATAAAQARQLLKQFGPASPPMQPTLPQQP